MASALQGFLAFDCDDELASRLPTEVAVAQGTGYDLHPSIVSPASVS